MRKVSRAEEQFSEVNFRTAQEKEAINLNVVHDVAQMAPHALNALKDVGHAVGQGVGHAIDWAKDTITRPIHDDHNFYDDVSNKAYEISQDLNHLKVTKDDMANAQGVITFNDGGHFVSALGAGAAALAVPAGIAKGIGMGVNKAIDTFGDRGQQRDRNKFLRKHPIIDKFSSFNDRYAFEKEAINLNVVHDVATMAPHVWNALKDVGHSVANEFDRARHDVAGVGHGIADVARGIGHGVADVAKGVGHGVSSLFDMGRHDVAGVGHSVANEFDRARHDVAGVGHGGSSLFDHARHDVAGVGHSVANEFDRARHDVAVPFAGVGHHDLDLAKTVGEAFDTRTNSPDSYNHILYNYLRSPSVGRFPKGTPNHEIYNIVQHWRANGGQMGGNALHNYPGLDKIFPGQGKASGQIISQDLKNKFDAMNTQGENQFMADVGSAALTGLVPAAIGLGIKQHRDKKLENRFSSFDDRYAFEKTAKGEGEKGFKPPAGVQSAARHALKLIEEGKAGDGFTSVGRGRAHQLANGETLSLSTVKRMHSYFSRHRVDKKGKDWDNNSPGKVAWLAWGGDAGASWAADICAKHDGKKEASAAEVLGLLTPAAIVAQPFIMDKINKRNDKKRNQEETTSTEHTCDICAKHDGKKESSAWPSSEHYEEHLEDLEELLHDTQKGVEWHEGQGEPAEKAKHQQLAEDLVKSIADARKLEK